MKLSKITKFISFVGLIAALSIVSVNSAAAATLLNKNQSDSIHMLTIHTPNNQQVEVRLAYYFGKLSDGSCNYKKYIDVIASISPGVYGISGAGIKQNIGEGFTCAKLEFTYKQTVSDSFQLLWDDKAKQYTGSIPPSSVVNIQ